MVIHTAIFARTGSAIFDFVAEKTCSFFHHSGNKFNSRGAENVHTFELTATIFYGEESSQTLLTDNIHSVISLS